MQFIGSNGTGPSEVTSCTEPTVLGTAEGDAASVDWSFATDSTATATTGYTYVTTHDEVRPLSGQLSDSSGKQSHGSSSPPVLTRVQSNSRISSDKKKKPYWYNVSSPRLLVIVFFSSSIRGQLVTG